MFNDIEKKIQKAQDRWDKIEKAADDVEGNLDFYAPHDKSLANLLLLLVEHLRPMNPTQEHLDTIKNLINLKK